MTLTLLLLRRHRAMLGSWLILLVALSGGTVSAYQSTYATDQQRRTAVELAQQNQATTLLYGRLPDPGTPAQMYAWEIGAFVTILAAVMAVLVAVLLTRSGEDDGTVELLRGCGISPREPLRDALMILAVVAVALCAGCTAAAGLAGRRVDGITWSGAFAFGAVVGLTFLFTAFLTTVFAQVAPTTRQARLLGLAGVGTAFALRAFADTYHHDILGWFSPLGLRATVQPFTTDRWAALVPALVGTAALAYVAAALNGRREWNAGLIRRRDSRGSHLHIRTTVGLTTRLARSSLIAWTTAVAAIGTILVTMGSDTVSKQRDSDLGGFLGAQLGSGDPAAGYLAYCDTVVGIIVATYAILSVTTSKHDETAGLTDLVLSTGVRRWTPLAAHTAVTAFGSAAMLLVTGALSALIAPPSSTAPTSPPARWRTPPASGPPHWPRPDVRRCWSAYGPGSRPWPGCLWSPARHSHCSATSSVCRTRSKTSASSATYPTSPAPTHRSAGYCFSPRWAPACACSESSAPSAATSSPGDRQGTRPASLVAARA